LQTIKNRLNEHMENNMVEEQCGLRKECSCTNATLTVQPIIERTQPTAFRLIDNEKPYSNVTRDKLWEMMDNEISNYLLNTIKCI
jgi:hypothetical protein